MKKLNIVATIHFRTHGFECEAKDKDESLEKLLETGLFDHVNYVYRVEEFEAKEE